MPLYKIYIFFRFEFEKNSVIKDSEEIQFQFKKAEKFLTNKWLV